jgi:protein ImuB
VPVAHRRFETPVTEWETVHVVTERLLAELFAQLERRSGALRRLECVLYFEDAAPRVLTVQLSRASRQGAHVAQLLLPRLEQVDRTRGVVGLMLMARETARHSGGQGGLFTPGEPAEDEALGCLVDRLTSRLGHMAVVRPTLVDDYQPEMAFRYVSVTEVGCVVDADGDPPPAPPWEGGGLGRPVRLLPRPVPIRVLALVPDGPPTWFYYHGREHLVADAAGPERIATAWWRGRDVQRDYFRVTAETGEQFWLFHARDRQQWYLQGVFA